jgi:hypothetical protein
MLIGLIISLIVIVGLVWCNVHATEKKAAADLKFDSDVRRLDAAYEQIEAYREQFWILHDALLKLKYEYQVKALLRDKLGEMLMVYHGILDDDIADAERAAVAIGKIVDQLRGYFANPDRYFTKAEVREVNELNLIPA